MQSEATEALHASEYISLQNTKPGKSPGGCTTIMLFPDMPCMRRVYKIKKAPARWSAARNKERPSFPRRDRLPTARQPVIVFPDMVYMEFNPFVPPKKPSERTSWEPEETAKRRRPGLVEEESATHSFPPACPPVRPSARPPARWDVWVLDSTNV